MSYSTYFGLEKSLKKQGYRFERDEIIQSLFPSKTGLRSLTHMEYSQLIQHMRVLRAGVDLEKRCNDMRRKIIAFFRKMGHEKGGKADMQYIYEWVIQYGRFHKPLYKHSYNELVKLLSQVDQVYKSYLIEIDKI